MKGTDNVTGALSARPMIEDDDGNYVYQMENNPYDE